MIGLARHYCAAVKAGNDFGENHGSGSIEGIRAFGRRERWKFELWTKVEVELPSAATEPLGIAEDSH